MISASIDLDAFDIRILAALQENARLGHGELAERVVLSPSQCGRRLKRLEDTGLIASYAALLDQQAVGLEVTAFVLVTLGRHGAGEAEGFHKRIAAMPEILECWSVTGDADYLLRVVAATLRAFSSFLTDSLLPLPNVSNVHSVIGLERIKQTSVLPLSQLAAG